MAFEDIKGVIMALIIFLILSFILYLLFRNFSKVATAAISIASRLTGYE